MAAEWRHVTGHFHAFIGNLQPTPLERRRAHAAATEVADCLRRQFAPPRPLRGRHLAVSGRPARALDDHVVIGGYGKGTAVRPSRSVDMLYILPAELRPPTAMARPMIASMAGEMSAALASTFATREQPDEGWLSVRSFSDVEVRLTPCFRTAGDALMVAASHATGAWLSTNPVAEAARLHQADLASGGKATHLIMMLKAWRRTHDVALTSLAIELLVTEFALAWIYPRRSLLFYDWMVRDFFFWLVHQARRELLTPGALERLHLGDAWLEAAARAYGQARRACAMEHDDREEEAAQEWRRIFGPEFSVAAIRLPAARQGGLNALPGCAATDC
jgi:hypothetical protein